MLIHLGNVKRGDRILVHAVAGGVGHAATDICHWRGADVIGTASVAKHERLKQLGVPHCIDSATQDFEEEIKRTTNGQGLDIALDAVGGRSFRKSYRCLRPTGRLFCFEVSRMSTATKRSLFSVLRGVVQNAFRPIPPMKENRGVLGMNMGHRWHRGEVLRRMTDEIVELVRAGRCDGSSA